MSSAMANSTPGPNTASAVRNLVENALKYAGHASVQLQKKTDQICIHVSDTGAGIPEHRREESMQPFVRLSSARESAQGGFGLGLALVKAVAKAHGGKLELKRNSPQGLVASLMLPL